MPSIGIPPVFASRLSFGAKVGKNFDGHQIFPTLFSETRRKRAPSSTFHLHFPAVLNVDFPFIRMSHSPSLEVEHLIVHF
jgi:hypothetical protein